MKNGTENFVIEKINTKDSTQETKGKTEECSFLNSQIFNGLLELLFNDLSTSSYDYNSTRQL